MGTVALLLTAAARLGRTARADGDARRADDEQCRSSSCRRRLAEQTDAPTEEADAADLRAHPQRSRAPCCSAVGVNDEAWLTAVAQTTTSQAGGGGYPQGLTKVDELAQVLRAADVFMAKLSPRALRGPPCRPATRPSGSSQASRAAPSAPQR